MRTREVNMTIVLSKKQIQYLINNYWREPNEIAKEINLDIETTNHVTRFFKLDEYKNSSFYRESLRTELSKVRNRKKKAIKKRKSRFSKCLYCGKILEHKLDVTSHKDLKIIDWAKRNYCDKTCYLLARDEGKKQEMIEE